MSYLFSGVDPLDPAPPILRVAWGSTFAFEYIRGIDSAKCAHPDQKTSVEHVSVGDMVRVAHTQIATIARAPSDIPVSLNVSVLVGELWRHPINAPLVRNNDTRSATRVCVAVFRVSVDGKMHAVHPLTNQCAICKAFVPDLTHVVDRWPYIEATSPHSAASVLDDLIGVVNAQHDCTVTELSVVHLVAPSASEDAKGSGVVRTSLTPAQREQVKINATKEADDLAHQARRDRALEKQRRDAEFEAFLVASGIKKVAAAKQKKKTAEERQADAAEKEQRAREKKAEKTAEANRKHQKRLEEARQAAELKELRRREEAAVEAAPAIAARNAKQLEKERAAEVKRVAALRKQARDHAKSTAIDEMMKAMEAKERAFYIAPAGGGKPPLLMEAERHIPQPGAGTEVQACADKWVASTQRAGGALAAIRGQLVDKYVHAHQRVLESIVRGNAPARRDGEAAEAYLVRYMRAIDTPSLQSLAARVRDIRRPLRTDVVSAEYDAFDRKFTHADDESRRLFNDDCKALLDARIAAFAKIDAAVARMRETEVTGKTVEYTFGEGANTQTERMDVQLTNKVIKELRAPLDAWLSANGRAKVEHATKMATDKLLGTMDQYIAGFKQYRATHQRETVDALDREDKLFNRALEMVLAERAAAVAAERTAMASAAAAAAAAAAVVRQLTAASAASAAAARGDDDDDLDMDGNDDSETRKAAGEASAAFERARTVYAACEAEYDNATTVLSAAVTVFRGAERALADAPRHEATPVPDDSERFGLNATRARKYQATRAELAKVRGEIASLQTDLERAPLARAYNAAAHDRTRAEQKRLDAWKARIDAYEVVGKTLLSASNKWLECRLSDEDRRHQTDMKKKANDIIEGVHSLRAEQRGHTLWSVKAIAVPNVDSLQSTLEQVNGRASELARKLGEFEPPPPPPAPERPPVPDEQRSSAPSPAPSDNDQGRAESRAPSPSPSNNGDDQASSRASSPAPDEPNTEPASGYANPVSLPAAGGDEEQWDVPGEGDEVYLRRYTDEELDQAGHILGGLDDDDDEESAREGWSDEEEKSDSDHAPVGIPVGTEGEGDTSRPNKRRAPGYADDANPAEDVASRPKRVRRGRRR